MKRADKKDPYYSKYVKKQKKKNEAEKSEEKSEEKFEDKAKHKKTEKKKKALKLVKKKDIPKDNISNPIRLNAFIAKAGICSRRQADDLIKSGKIKINGEVVVELGVSVSYSDEVEYRGKVLKGQNNVYILMNKPKDSITSTTDPEGRRTVFDLLKNATNERVYPVGRLDRNTTGVLLLTNDGDLTEKLTHPKYKKRKIYEVVLDKPLTSIDLEKILDGVEIDVGTVIADAVEYVDSKDKTIIGIEIHSGQNRVVRKIFEVLGYDVKKLDRVYFAGLTKKNLSRGKWRFLTEREVGFLKMKSFK
ncbi:MAG: rRNA pseudouridine synthase [Bacteroidales bacterium]|nr:rRNA pseudouridine synthase [Bacteroidales bacterium]